MRKPRIAVAFVSCVIVVGLIGTLALADGGAGAQHRRARSLPRASALSGRPSATSAARFAFLTRQTSNSCGLQPSALVLMPTGMRLQGSCCSPMDLTAYRSQLRGLTAYSSIFAIPRDPYDLPASLAKRLLSYDQTIRLSPTQTRTYSQAMQLSTLKGPCCCRCWRWYAFRGLSKHLIADLNWRSARIAALTELLEGCGGPARSA